MLIESKREKKSTVHDIGITIKIPRELVIQSAIK